LTQQFAIVFFLLMTHGICMQEFKFRYTVDDIQEIPTGGPWDSKSGGTLDVLFAFSHDQITKFLDFDNPEFEEAKRISGVDIRGLRSYTVRNIPKGSVGANEWHRARTEYVRVLSGSAVWECLDFKGNKKQVVLSSRNGVISPPGLLHTYRALEDGTALQVICNTLFVPEDPLTHDSFSADTFPMATDES